MTLVREVLDCPHCGTRHVDRGEYARKNHSRHLCLKGDGGCGRFFFTRANVGVAEARAGGPRQVDL